MLGNSPLGSAPLASIDDNVPPTRSSALGHLKVMGVARASVTITVNGKAGSAGWKEPDDPRGPLIRLLDTVVPAKVRHGLLGDIWERYQHNRERLGKREAVRRAAYDYLGTSRVIVPKVVDLLIVWVGGIAFFLALLRMTLDILRPLVGP